MAEGPIELIRLEGEGNSVVLRITGKERPHAGTEALAGELLVDTPFVRGSVSMSVPPEELREWQEALDALDAGEDVAWREGSGGPEMFIDREVDGGRVHVTIKDTSTSPTAVTVTVPLVDAWFDDAYQRLDACEAWAVTGD